MTSVLKGADGLPAVIDPYSIKEHHVTLWCVFLWDVYFIYSLWKTVNYLKIATSSKIIIYV